MISFHHITKKFQDNEIDMSISGENITLNNLNTENAKIDIYNILGNNISKLTLIIKNFNSFRLNTSKLPEGIYFIVLYYEGKYKSYKFCK